MHNIRVCGQINFNLCPIFMEERYFFIFNGAILYTRDFLVGELPYQKNL